MNSGGFHQGFTLVELLVVVSIIALLISILLPSLRSARETAKGAHCLANLRRLGSSAAIYLAENEGRFFPFRLSTANPAGGAVYVNEHGAQQPRWQWFLSTGTGPVIDPSQFAHLPGGQFGDGSTNEAGEPRGTIMTNDYFLCPNLTGEYARDIRNGAYGFNYQYLGNSRTIDSAVGKVYVNFPVRESQIPAASSTVIFADSRGADPRHGKHSYSLDPPRLAVEHDTDQFGPKSPGDGPIAHSPAETRHLGKAGVSFVDGHAETLTLEQLGYELGPDGVVAPDPGDGTTADNRLWTGLARDPVTAARRGR